jgi:hypothetical protein
MPAAVGIVTGALGATPMGGVVGSIVSGVVGNVLGNIGGESGGGPFGALGNLANVANSFTSAFGGLVGQMVTRPLMDGLFAPSPQPFSPCCMSPQTFNDPLAMMKDFMQEFGGAFDSISNSFGSNGPGGGLSAALPSFERIAPGEFGGFKAARDPGFGSPGAPLGSGSSGGGGSFGGSGRGLNGLQADVDRLRERVINNPNDIQAQVDLQKAMQKLQVTFNAISQTLAIQGQLAKQAIQNMKL